MTNSEDIDFIRAQKNITRVEVIEQNEGRVYVNNNASEASVSLQDGGRTLKIFVNYKPSNQNAATH